MYRDGGAGGAAGGDRESLLGAPGERFHSIVARAFSIEITPGESNHRVRTHFRADQEFPMADNAVRTCSAIGDYHV